MVYRSLFAVMLIAGIACFTFAAVQGQQDQEEEGKKKQDKEKIEIPQDGPDAIARRDFMRTKLMYSQNIFEGLTTGDFELIRDGVSEVKKITEGARWVQIDNDKYRKLTADFETTIRRLEEAVEGKNIEATALRYYQMSTSCIDCHQHLRLARYEF